MPQIGAERAVGRIKRTDKLAEALPDGKPPRSRPSRCAAAGRAARAGGRNASAGANSAAAARQARFSVSRKDRPHCGNGAFAGAKTGGSRRRGFCGGLMRMRGIRP